MPRIVVTLAYHGADFHGWQLQPGDRTVQGEVEGALKTITGLDIRVHGSGRTDAGVHALAQHAHFDIPESKISMPWLKALNAVLPRDVRVMQVRTVPDDFHVRYSAVDKTYAYTLCIAEVADPLRRGFAWHTGPLDRAALDEAAAAVVGAHDFKGFQNTGTPVKSTVRTIHESAFHPSPFEGELIYRVRADGFLKQMVRNLAGCLVAAGRGKVDADFIRSILKGRDRTLAPPTAPAHGLCLEQVRY